MRSNLFALILSLLILPFLFISCTGSKDNVENQNGISGADSVYVFDQPVTTPKHDSVMVKPKVESKPPAPPAPKQINYYYIVQIGAFSTKDKASAFADSVKKDLKYAIEISYSSTVSLYVVHLMPPYKSKAEAENVRNELWKMNKFKDAWILMIKE